MARSIEDHTRAKAHYESLLGADTPYDERMRKRVDEATDDAFGAFFEAKSLLDAKMAISRRSFR